MDLKIRFDAKVARTSARICSIDRLGCPKYAIASNDAVDNGEQKPMAERSFEREVRDLRLGAGEVFRGEGILAITKALLQSGV